MKKFLVLFICFLFALSVQASDDIDCIKYKSIRNNAKISYDTAADIWSTKIDKKKGIYFIKKEVMDGYYEYQTPEGNTAFRTGASYEFINDGSLIGYSNDDLKFYRYSYANGVIKSEALTLEEVEAMLPKVRVVTLSEFSPNTNSLKIKKAKKHFNILIFNDTDNIFSGYTFSSNNAEYETYAVKGLLTITKKGMIQFSKDGSMSSSYPWYVLLIR